MHRSRDLLRSALLLNERGAESLSVVETHEDVVRSAVVEINILVVETSFLARGSH